MKRPMDDAPKDGSVFLLELQSGDLVPARWQEGTYWDGNTSRGAFVRATDPAGETWHAIMPDDPQPSAWAPVPTDEEIGGLEAELRAVVPEAARPAVDKYIAIQREIRQPDVDPQLEQLERWHRRLGGDE